VQRLCGLPLLASRRCAAASFARVIVVAMGAQVVTRAGVIIAPIKFTNAKSKSKAQPSAA
jgi:hypothetical protein